MFKEFGYSKDYYHKGKFIGSLISEKDREIYGYCGRIKEILKTDIVFKNKKKIKKGEEVTTEIFPLNGRIIKN
jgi:hypothetical protein